MHTHVQEKISRGGDQHAKMHILTPCPPTTVDRRKLPSTVDAANEHSSFSKPRSQNVTRHVSTTAKKIPGSAPGVLMKRGVWGCMPGAYYGC